MSTELTALIKIHKEFPVTLELLKKNKNIVCLPEIENIYK